MVHESICKKLMNSSLLTQSMHQYTTFPIPVFYIVNNTEVNPLQCKLDVRSLSSDYTGKRPQGNFLAGIARCRSLVFQLFARTVVFHDFPLCSLNPHVKTSCLSLIQTQLRTIGGSLSVKPPILTS